MNYYWMVGKDIRHNNWLFYTDSLSEGVLLRTKYKKLKCQKCKKIDELKALKLGLENDIKLRCKNDIFLTDDGFVCVNQKVKSLLERLKVSNCKFVTIPNEKRYVILLPTRETTSNLKKGEMKFLLECKKCGRFQETLFLPSLLSLKLPNKELILIHPDILFESSRGREYWFLLSEDLVNKFKGEKISGVEFLKAK